MAKKKMKKGTVGRVFRRTAAAGIGGVAGSAAHNLNPIKNRWVKGGVNTVFAALIPEFIQGEASENAACGFIGATIAKTVEGIPVIGDIGDDYDYTDYEEEYLGGYEAEELAMSGTEAELNVVS